MKKKKVVAIPGSISIEAPNLNLHDDGIGNLLNSKGIVVGKIDYKKKSISFNDDDEKNGSNLLPG